jgi:hypothetical protein
MIVRLTVRQAGRVRDLVATSFGDNFLGEAFAGWWDGYQSTASKHRVDIVMPASAWRRVEGIMFDHCFDERGFRARERVRSTDINALKSIRRALNVRENHPALYQRGAIGLISELIPAWKFPAPDASGKVYSPYPVQSMPFVVLAPESRTVQTKQTTIWVEAIRPRELPLLYEPGHWVFVQ